MRKSILTLNSFLVNMKKKQYLSFPRKTVYLCTILPALLLSNCQQEKGQSAVKQDKPVDKRIKQMEPAQVSQLAQSIEASVSPKLSKGLTLRIWGVDSLVADPIALDIDDQGRVYYTRTNRQKNSEFDIRGHQDWEIESISLQTIDDKRAFLRKVLSPENSKKNEWLKDLNGDGSHDWKDMTIEKEHVYRIEDSSGDGLADKSQLVVEDFNDEVTDVAGAVLADGEDLYVGVGPDFWKLKDTDGDGLADDKKSLSHGYGIHVGFGGHGMSGAEMGPDGKVYWGIGDIGFNGKGPDGTKWEHPNSGVIVRCNPDGSDFEVFAHGLRNTHEFTFDEYGNLISQDNDGDHPGEKERLVYVVNGSDTGWRINWQFGKYRDPDNNTYKVWMDEQMYKPRFEGQAAYITPTITNFVSGPTGFLYNPGTALSPKYKNTFFVVEFNGNPARSGIHAFKLKPKGASFELGEQEQIMSNVLATGIDFGPDGAMYVADWIDGWDTKDHGRIWKLDVAEGANSPERTEVKTLLGEDFSKRPEDQLGQLLSHQDMRVRQKAQFELAKRGAKGVEQFQKSINQTANQLARVHGIWGMAQVARKDAKQAQVLLPLLKDQDPEIRAQAAKWLGDIRYKEAGSALLPLLADQSSRARFFAAEALGRIAYEPAINPIIEMLKANNDADAYLRHAGSLALARIGKADPIVALHTSPSKALRIAAVVALRRLQHPGIANFLNDKDEFVVTETARAINDDLSIKEALPALGDLLATTPFKNEPLIRRAINANLRVGTDKAMQNLINYSMKETAPAAMRAEAIDALSTWSKPSVVDRVDGRYRGVIERDPMLVKNKASESLIKLVSTSQLPVRLSAVKAVGKHKIEGGSEKLFALLKNDSKPEVRIEALRALASLENAPIDKAIQQALDDKEKSVRVAGLDLLAKMDISKDLMVSLLSEVINTRTTEEKQAALLTLGKLPVANSQKVFDGLLTKLSNGNFPAEIQLELAEAIDSTKSTELQNRYKEVTAKLSPDAVAAAYEASLVGGNVDEGRKIFFRHQTAQCLRCHSYDDLGGNAGPRLNGVASRLSRKQLLEAVINPSARLAPGFGAVTLTLAGDKTISGILQEENNKGVVLKIGDRPDTLIRKEQIVKRTNAPSSMPDMKQLLTPREVRDVVSFLATLKEEM
ncbi:HEAT repeat domain-containing protein [Rhodocytophaga aerolata]|uniref:HEAT repeat domain-containing protein n=2 Tax=Rhodocytophaga aerolata TaxID=455078 RepID=A0ABT8R8P6_9BACT|nr:HEAT repeat domain-containing protein [Rhodocytophaga aerolata]MDO1447117.1 HEAT repeat domain-containing protein [Rhodocytophaga aerolata]